jgi:hypothetical protein
MNGKRIAGMFAQGSKALYAATGDFRFVTDRVTFSLMSWLKSTTFAPKSP